MSSTSLAYKSEPEAGFHHVSMSFVQVLRLNASSPLGAAAATVVDGVMGVELVDMDWAACVPPWFVRVRFLFCFHLTTVHFPWAIY